MSGSKRLLVDLSLAGSVPFVAVWLYEFSNFIVMAAQGFSVSLTVSGLLPVGVAGVSVGALSPLTKVFQIALSVSFLLPVAVLLSKKGFVIARAFVVSSAGIYIASAYWEFLSSLNELPMTLHTGLFVAGTGAMTLGLLWGLARPTQNTQVPSLSEASSRRLQTKV